MPNDKPRTFVCKNCQKERIHPKPHGPLPTYCTKLKACREAKRKAHCEHVKSNYVPKARTGKCRRPGCGKVIICPPGNSGIPNWCPDDPVCQEAKTAHNKATVAANHRLHGYYKARADKGVKYPPTKCSRCKKIFYGPNIDRCPLCVEKQASIYWHLDEQAGFPS